MMGESLVRNLLFWNTKKDDYSPTHSVSVTVEIGLQSFRDQGWSNLGCQSCWNGADYLGSMKVATPSLDEKVTFTSLDTLYSTTDSQLTSYAAIMCNKLL